MVVPLCMIQVRFLGLALTIITVLFVLLGIFIFPLILRQLRISLRARRDHRSARGTLHLKQIRESLKVLDEKLKRIEREKHELETVIRRLNQNQSMELLHALSIYIVKTRLSAEVEGIGPELQDRIINQCFDGTLGSLRKADNVYGIGRRKMMAILKWVDKWERKIPHLLEEDFPNKSRIIEEYARETTQLKNRLNEIEGKVLWIRDIKKLASAEGYRLSQVRSSHFRKSYKMDEKASEAVNRYIQGVFPEWAPMPKWFRDLSSLSGD